MSKDFKEYNRSIVTNIQEYKIEKMIMNVTFPLLLSSRGVSFGFSYFIEGTKRVKIKKCLQQKRKIIRGENEEKTRLNIQTSTQRRRKQKIRITNLALPLSPELVKSMVIIHIIRRHMQILLFTLLSNFEFLQR